MRGLSDQDYSKITNIFYKKMLSKNGSIDFKDIEELFSISKRRYVVMTIEQPEMNHVEPIFREIKISVNG